MKRTVALLFATLALLWALPVLATQPTTANSTKNSTFIANQCTTDVPTGMTNGQTVVVVTLAELAGSDAVSGTPSGSWTNFNDVVYPPATLRHYWYVYAGETGTYTFTFSTNSAFFACWADPWENANIVAPI